MYLDFATKVFFAIFFTKSNGKQKRLRFVLADLMKMKVDSKEFKDVSQHITNDMDWDESNPIEKAYKAAGLQRFHVSSLKSLSNDTTSQSYKESVETSKQGSSKHGLLEIDKGVCIKVEGQAAMEWKSKIQVLESGKKSLERQLMALEDVIETLLLKAKGSTSLGHLKSKGEDGKKNSLPALQAQLSKVRTKLAEYKEMAVDGISEAQINEITLEIENASNFCDATKLWIRKASKLLDD